MAHHQLEVPRYEVVEPCEPVCQSAAGAGRSKLRVAVAVAAASLAVTTAGAAALAVQRHGPGTGAPFGASVRGAAGRRAPLASVERLWQDIPDNFFALGSGACLDREGQKATSVRVVTGASVLADGSSPECEEECSNDDQCTGYMTHDTEDGVWLGGRSGKCGIISGSSFEPISADGGSGSKCFWRKQYLEKSETAYNGADLPIPKVIWSFWSNQDESAFGVPPFVDMCVRSWRQLNPDYAVRILNLTTMWTWVKHEDFPKNFKNLSAEHRSDLLRLTLLSRHGGAWLDASVFLVRPMRDLLSGRRNERTFLHMPLIGATGSSPEVHDARVSDIYHAYTWFLAAPQGDELISRTRSCMLEVLSSENRTEGLAHLNMFSAEELEEMPIIGLGNGIGRHLAVDACMFKTINEDESMENWWLSSKVRHINPIQGMNMWWWTDLPLARQVLFHRANASFAGELAGAAVYALPFDSMMRPALTEGVPSEVLWCTQNTWHMVLDKVNISNDRVCAPAAQAS